MFWVRFLVAAWPREVVMEEMEAATVASSKRARESLENPLDWATFSFSSDSVGPLTAQRALVSRQPQERGVSSAGRACDRTV